MLLGYVGAMLASSPVYCEKKKAADDFPADERRLLRRVKVEFDDEPLEESK